MSNTQADNLLDVASAVEDIYRLEARGEYDQAAGLIEQLAPHKRPPEGPFLLALHALLSEGVCQGEPWRQHLDHLARRNGADVLLSSFQRSNGFAVAEAIEAARDVGSNTGRLEPGQWRVVTNGEQTCSREIPIDTAPVGVAAHLLLKLRSNVNDSFYLHLRDHDQQRDESLRFSRTSLTLCRDASRQDVDATRVRLYSLIAQRGHVSIYVNGRLQWRRRRPEGFRPRAVQIELIGKHGGDLEANVLGLEIWALGRKFEGMVEDERGLLDQRLRQLMDSRNGRAVWQMLESIEGLDLMPLQRQALDLMEDLAKRTDGTPEWIIDTLDQALPEDARQIWRQRRAQVMPKPVLVVEDLRVTFSRNPAADWSVGRILRRKQRDRFNVLDEVNFRVFPGDVLGIIGQNGAGKSTLLRTLAGLIPVKKGRVYVEGQAVLLKAGVGMKPHLTGRDNVLHAGTFMGLSRKKIREIIDDVIEFSELGEAIDRPFKYYSDGMKSRLIFSMATSIAPEILMLDELLGAGDVRFRQKAQERLDSFIASAKVVIVVTHGLNFVRDRCNKAVFLSSGRQMYFGDPETAIAHYLNELHLLPSAVGLSDDSGAIDDAALTLAEMEMGEATFE